MFVGGFFNRIGWPRGGAGLEDILRDYVDRASGILFR